MASHADRLKQSECFKVMAEKNGDASGLRPYKNALTCVTCHNPHVSVRKAGSAVFNAKCNSCHSGAGKSVCSEKEMVRSIKENDCVSCHMPVSGSLDIPHVTVHDHYIRKRPVPVSSSPERGKFKGLASINSKSPDKLSQAKAYIQQFEKFDPDKLYMLDSAMVRLDEKDENTFRQYFYLYVNLYFAKRDYGKVAELTKRYGESILISKDLNRQSWDNQDAWTAYRIGESFSALGSAQQAFQFFKVAYRLAPYQFEFANKYGSSALMMNNLVEAERVFQKLTEEIPVYAPGWTNLGYLRLLNGDDQTAEKCYKKALSLNPDYTQASINLAGLYVYRGNGSLARTVLLGVLKREPNNQEIKDILKKIPSR
jgi:tetratricopeptide (TPR) repeat protein